MSDINSSNSWQTIVRPNGANASMEKKLVTVGNGLAFFIDRSLQRLLGIEKNTVVTVTTDGVRLTIEPCGLNERPKKARLEPWDAPNWVRLSWAQTSEERRLDYYAVSVIAELIERGVEEEHMLQLHHRYFPPELHRDGLLMPRPHHLDEHDIDDFRRLERCLMELRAGATMDTAVSTAVDAVPIRHREPSRIFKTGPYSLDPEIRALVASESPGEQVAGKVTA
jgi:hypothetical protein